MTDTIEGIEYPEIFAYSVQHHPEAGPGPMIQDIYLKTLNNILKNLRKLQVNQSMGLIKNLKNQILSAGCPGFLTGKLI